MQDEPFARFNTPPAKLWHAATPELLKAYHDTGAILAPVRGFDSDRSAMVWAMRTGRQIIIEIDLAGIDQIAMLPDSRCPFGASWWTPADVPVSQTKVIVSPDEVPQRRADDK